MSISTEYLERCITSLETGVELITQADPSDKLYDVYRSAVIKEFELTLEQSGKLLRRALLPYFSSKKKLDELVFVEYFKHAANHGMIDIDAAERWAVYRKNRNSTAHDYGLQFVEQTLPLLPSFVEDTRALLAVFRRIDDDTIA